MPQEHYVLKCFSCSTFQVHIVKKAKKWECKLCGAKQSFKRHYGKGTGADCRKQVMKLNELRITNKRIQDEIPCEYSSPPKKCKEEKPTVSKWEAFLETDGDIFEDCDVTASPPPQNPTPKSGNTQNPKPNKYKKYVEEENTNENNQLLNLFETDLTDFDDIKL